MADVFGKKFRIAMIGARDIPVREGSGGVERHVEELSARLAACGHDVTCFVRRRKGMPASATHRGFRLRPVPSFPHRNFEAITRTLSSVLRAMSGRYDIIHFHGVGPATFAWLPRVFCPRAKTVVTFHSVDRLHAKWGPFARLYLRFGEWAAVHYPHLTIAVSRSVQKYCDGEFGAETMYVPNGATVSPYPGDDMLLRWGLKRDGYVLAVGRLVGQKGFHYLIEAFEQVETDKKLVIVGGDAQGGDYADYLRWMASGNSAIVLTGFQYGRALAQLFANAYLYVHPSEAEGMSLSILEAMAAGRCVLASDIPENREPLDGSGVTFASADAVSLASTMQSLLNHPEVVRERAERAVGWVSSEYGWDRVAAMTERAYGDLC